MQWRIETGKSGKRASQERAEYMGLCKKGDLYGASLYTTGGASEFYDTWHLKSPADKDELVARIKASAEDKARVYYL
jgi:hypothetical protein